MTNLKLFPVYTIPGFLLLLGLLSLVFQGAGKSPQDIISFLNNQKVFLPYLSIAAIAASYIIGASANRLGVWLFTSEGAEDTSFSKWIPILQHGSQAVNAELGNVYAGMMLFRLLTGSVSFAGLFSFWLCPNYSWLIFLITLILLVFFLIMYRLSHSSFKNFENRCFREISNRIDR